MPIGGEGGGGGGGGGATVGMRGGRTTTNSALDGPATGQPLGVHPGGYAWYRPEDEPGFAWKNKKAQEEWGRAWDQVLDKDIMVLSKLGWVLLSRFCGQDIGKDGG